VNITVLKTDASFSKAAGFIGHVQFQFENHKQPYEITLQSDNGETDWNYAINFANESGSEAEIQALDERLEVDDDLFAFLINAVKQNAPA